MAIHVAWLREPQGSSELGAGERALEPRLGTPLKDATPYELLCMLLGQGWAWRPLPKTAKAVLALPPFVVRAGPEAPDRNRIFYSRLIPSVAYMRCLLGELSLGEQIVNVPHGCTNSVYEQILNGTPAQAHRKKKRRLAVDDRDKSPVRRPRRPANRALAAVANLPAEEEPMAAEDACCHTINNSPAINVVKLSMHTTQTHPTRLPYTARPTSPHPSHPSYPTTTHHTTHKDEDDIGDADLALDLGGDDAEDMGFDLVEALFFCCIAVFLLPLLPLPLLLPLLLLPGAGGANRFEPAGAATARDT